MHYVALTAAAAVAASVVVAFQCGGGKAFVAAQTPFQESECHCKSEVQGLAAAVALLQRGIASYNVTCVFLLHGSDWCGVVASVHVPENDLVTAGNSRHLSWFLLGTGMTFFEFNHLTIWRQFHEETTYTHTNTYCNNPKYCVELYTRQMKRPKMGVWGRFLL